MGTFMRQWGNWVPFDDAIAKLGPYNAMEKWRALKYVMGKLGVLDGAIENLGPLGLDTGGELGTLDDAEVGAP